LLCYGGSSSGKHAIKVGFSSRLSDFMTFTIKHAEAKDLAAINALLMASKASWGYDKIFMEAYMRNYSVTLDYLNARKLQTVYLGLDLMAFFSFFIHEDQTLELERMYLDPKHIGQGYGRKIWQACCDYAKMLDKKEFIVWSDPNAQDFYRKMGCVQIGVRASPLMPDRSPPVFKYTLS
jgi:GNAT superfamily N-acetyltransferase